MQDGDNCAAACSPAAHNLSAIVKVSLVVIAVVIGVKVFVWSLYGVTVKDHLEHIFSCTKCAIDLFKAVSVVLVVVFSVVVVVLIAEEVWKLFFQLVLRTLKLACLEGYTSLPSYSPKLHAKGYHTKQREHTQHSTNSGK